MENLDYFVEVEYPVPNIKVTNYIINGEIVATIHQSLRLVGNVYVVTNTSLYAITGNFDNVTLMLIH